MRKSFLPAVCCLFVASIVFPLAGCIAHAPSNGGGGGGGGNQQTTVTVSPTTATVSGGSTTTFTASVKGPELTGVTWYVNGIQNGKSTLGTLTAGTNTSGTTTAVYTAPSPVPNPPTVNITAVAVANGTTSAPSTVTITPSLVNITIDPTTASINAGGKQQFTATVTGTTNTAVGWFVDDIPGGNFLTGSGAVGLISSTGLYSAPTNVNNSAQVTIMAEAQADSSKTATAPVNITGTSISIAAVPPTTNVPVQVPVGGTQEFGATVTGTSNTAVENWQVNGIPGGSSTVGTIVSSGSNTAVYTAPTSVNAVPFTVTISAVSSANSASSGSILANVHVTVTVSPATDTIGQGANLQFTATVNGSTNQSVIWNATCSQCPPNQTGGKFDINNLGLYYAPGFGVGVTQVTDSITAAPAIDPSATPGTATMTVLANDPLGTVTPSTPAAAQISCPTFGGGLSGATCYQLKVSCDAVADYNVYLKVNTPTTPVGTVIFGTGSGGNTLYDDEPSFIVGAVNGGETIVQGVFNAGYTTVQVSYGGPFDSNASTNGWLQGPGGVRRLACRYATAADWVYKNIHNSNKTLPLCATGHREGSGALGYAVTEYGLASEFSLIEHTSGPAMTLLHWGCNVCGGQFVGSDPCTHATGVNMCYSPSSGGSDIDASLIDAAYQVAGQTTPTLCTNGINADNTNFSRFLSDSIEDDPGVNPKFPIPNPPTNVNVVFGTLDTGTVALPQGYAWWGGVGPTPPAPTCVPTAAQAIPADNTPVTGGAAQILSDITSKCTVH